MEGSKVRKKPIIYSDSPILPTSKAPKKGEAAFYQSDGSIFAGIDGKELSWITEYLRNSARKIPMRHRADFPRAAIAAEKPTFFKINFGFAKPGEVDFSGTPKAVWKTDENGNPLAMELKVCNRETVEADKKDPSKKLKYSVEWRIRVKGDNYMSFHITEADANRLREGMKAEAGEGEWRVQVIGHPIEMK